MSAHAASALRTARSARLRSARNLCTTPPATLFLANGFPMPHPDQDKSSGRIATDDEDKTA